MTRRIPAVFVILALVGTPWAGAAAQSSLAGLYYLGRGVPQNGENKS